MLILNLIVAVCLVGTAKRKRSRSESFTKVMIFLYSVLKVPTFCLDSSKVEHAAVNRGVVGSSPVGPITHLCDAQLCRCGSIGRAADL